MAFYVTVQRLNDWTGKRQAVFAALDAMVNDGMRAQSFEGDRTSGHSTVTDDDGTTMPAVSDPTGETVLRPDRARTQLAEAVNAEADIVRAAASCYGTDPTTIRQAKQTLWVYANHDRPRVRDLEARVERAVRTLHRISVGLFCETCTHPVPHPCRRHSSLTAADLQAEREKLGKVDPDRVCCFCGNEPPCTKNPTTVNGNLPHPRTVGRTCYDRIRQTGRPPTRQDLDHLNRAGKWPKIRERA